MNQSKYLFIVTLFNAGWCVSWVASRSNKTNNTYAKINKIINQFIQKKDKDLYNIEEKQKSVALTEAGQSTIEELLLSNKFIDII